jgi:UDP-N-acetylglucosamine--N-acetylmuramyl-(pentapeptide) pyrophosphoryl-undecaprenol N-acetylglucosamine transferase
MSKAVKIVITGGHAATTALAVVEEIQRRRKVIDEIHWIGSAKAIEGKTRKSLESQILPKVGVIFHPITTGRLQRKFSRWTIPSLFKLPLGFLQAFFILIKIKPRVTLSFGGYASVPVVFWSWILGIPVIIHEQTNVAGRANLMCARFAKRILLSRASSLIYYPKGKCTVIGNPLLHNYFVHGIIPDDEEIPVVFITGGSRGSRTINDLVDQSLEKLLSYFRVIHQVGILELEKFQKRRQSLRSDLQEKYQIFDSVDPSEMVKIYNKADIVVARAGANTVAEIIALKKPALLIPIPWSYLNEQYENAKFARGFGVAEILNQPNATVDRFLYLIIKLYANRDSIANLIAPKDSPDEAASDKLVDILLATIC